MLGPFGLGGKTGAWANSNLGVLVALTIGFVVILAFSRATVRAEEAESGRLARLGTGIRRAAAPPS